MQDPQGITPVPLVSPQQGIPVEVLSDMELQVNHALDDLYVFSW